MAQVVFPNVSRRTFAKLPTTNPPLAYVGGDVVREEEGAIIFEGLTLDEFLRLPEAKPALEYIDGKVVQKVSPKATHSVFQRNFLGGLDAHGRQRRLGRAYPELRCTFGGRSVVPDISFFMRGRLLRDKWGRFLEDVFLPPDLAVEIISRGETIKNLTEKLDFCIRNGVRLGWLVQPTRERVFAFQPGHPTEILEGATVLTGGGVLPEFTLPLPELFGWLTEED